MLDYGDVQVHDVILGGNKTCRAGCLYSVRRKCPSASRRCDKIRADFPLKSDSVEINTMASHCVVHQGSREERQAISRAPGQLRNLRVQEAHYESKVVCSQRSSADSRAQPLAVFCMS